MFLIYGKRTARIKAATDHHERCNNCGEFDISVIVLRPYFHIFYIPVLPVGPKHVKAWCHNCGQSFGSVAFEKAYEDKAKTPIYFYSIPILICLLVAVAVYGNITTQQQKAELILHPRSGDKYLVRKDEKDSTFYYFLRVESINGDTVTVLHNDVVYFSFTTLLAPGDSFITANPLRYTKHDLKKMFDADEINYIER